jgi:hypothetical protein
MATYPKVVDARPSKSFPGELVSEPVPDGENK